MGGSLSKRSQGKTVCGETVMERKIIIWGPVCGIIPGENPRPFNYYAKRYVLDVPRSESLDHLMIVEPELCNRRIMHDVHADMEANWPKGWECDGLGWRLPHGINYCFVQRGRKGPNPTAVYSRQVPCKCGGREHPIPEPLKKQGPKEPVKPSKSDWLAARIWYGIFW